MLRFDGKKDPDRRAAVERGDWAIDDTDLAAAAAKGSFVFVPDMLAYRKTTLTYASRIKEPFEVDTLEGLHQGKAGDFLAIGPHGEAYPIDAAVFRDSYELAEQQEEETP
jgi:hypothetical protein